MTDAMWVPGQRKGAGVDIRVQCVVPFMVLHQSEFLILGCWSGKLSEGDGDSHYLCP